MPEIQPFRIPKAIWLCGRRIEIQYDENMAAHDMLGQSQYRENRIRLQPDAPHFHRAEGDVEQTFFHELVHWICSTMGRRDLDGDEAFIDMFASLLQQGLTMVEYDDA